jgi:hypothetical protein
LFSPYLCKKAPAGLFEPWIITWQFMQARPAALLLGAFGEEAVAVKPEPLD